MGNAIEETQYISNTSRIAENVRLESPVRTYRSVTIRKGCRVGGFSFINHGTTLFPRTEVGRFCSIGKYCEIGAFDHPTTWLSSSPFQYNMNHFPDFDGTTKLKKLTRPEAVTIGNDVWIGSGVIVKRGVKIGHGAILGGGAVVIKDVPDYAIVGGVPAKLLRYRFSPEIIERLLKSKWWERPIEEIGSLPFDNIEQTLNLLEETPTTSGDITVPLQASNEADNTVKLTKV